MSYNLAAIVLTLGMTVGCASRSEMPAQAGAGTANTPGAEAAAQLTPQDYEKFMKSVGTAFPSMQKHLMANMPSEAADDAQELARLFGDVERFWAQHEKADAVKLAQTARTHASQAAGAATAGDVAKASQEASAMQGACKQCHGLYREMDPAGGFRMKAEAIAPR